MFLFIIFLFGLLLPFLLMKYKSKWAKWIPAILFLIGTFIMGIKAWIFPGPEMSALGDIIYFIILGSATIGTIIGAIIVGVMKK
ncbi:hypothetical protein ACIFOT_15280 [Neobacillus sp. NRS-1170]|uniref:hypothetical protein n=1 Tax=Neobacillus sp. NRS-1170 TaxID=3233898 RepID=UPI003D2DB541